MTPKGKPMRKSNGMRGTRAGKTCFPGQCTLSSGSECFDSTRVPGIGIPGLGSNRDLLPITHYLLPSVSGRPVFFFVKSA